MKTHLSRFIYVMILALVLAACTLSGRIPPPDIVDTWQPPKGAESAPPMSCDEIKSVFAYDASGPLDIQEVSRSEDAGLTIIDLTYASPKGGRVPATLVIPEGQGPLAGIIFEHGAPGNRQQWIPSAKTYARLGAVVILIDAPFNRPEHGSTHYITYSEKDRLEQIQFIVDLRRAIDLMLSRQDVDPQRLAYVGVSYGGIIGGLLAGVEDRLKGYVLLVGDGGIVTHLTGKGYTRLSTIPEKLRKQWIAWMWPIEPIHYVGCASPAALLFQNGTLDINSTPANALQYQKAGSEPKTIQWYKGAHETLPAQAYYDQMDWLRRIIGISNYRRSFPASLRGILAAWFILTFASLVFLMIDLWRTRSVPPGVWCLWLLTTLFLGPFGIVVYWLSYRQTRNPGRPAKPIALSRRALGSAAWAAAGTMIGVFVTLGLILYILGISISIDNLFVALALLAMIFLLPLCTGRLSFAASRWLSRSEEVFLKAYQHSFRTELVSTLLILLGAYPTLVVLIGKYFVPWTAYWNFSLFDLSYPPLWAGFSLATLAGILVAYPFHLWMIRRGVIRWGEVSHATRKVA